MIVEDGHPVEKVSNLADMICGISIIVWGFKARNRMNQILDSAENDSKWFHGLWTFLFSPLYFNFKINQLNEMVILRTRRDRTQ